MVSSRSVEFNTFPFLLSLGAEAETSVVFVFMAFVDSFLVEDFEDDDDDDDDDGDKGEDEGCTLRAVVTFFKAILSL